MNPPALRAPWRVIWFVVVFALSFGLYTRDNRFPWLYHNDEPSKVSQITDSTRNFNHPVLMLTMVDGVTGLLGTRHDPQAVVETGRTLSAFYLAVGNALFVDLAVAWAGPLAGLALAVVLLAQPELYEIAHYFKEDTLLLFGLAAAFWALACFGAQPNRRRGLLLGAALAVLAGSKYVGWFWAVWIAGKAATLVWRSNRRMLLWMLGAFAVVTFLIYVPALREWKTAREAGEIEVMLLRAGDYGSGLAVPHSLYWRDLALTFPWKILVVGSLGLVLAGARNRPPGSTSILFSSLILLSAMSWLAKYSDRYSLPVVYLMSFVVVTGPVLALRRWWPEKGPQWLTRNGAWVAQLAAVGIAWVLVRADWPEMIRRREAFRVDSRAVMTRYLQEHYHGNLVLAEDEWARVQVPLATGRVLPSWFVADMGTLDDLRRQGITHVLVSFDVAHRYLDDSVPQFDQADFARRREFYHRLFNEGRVELFLPSAQPKALQPGLTLMDIRKLGHPQPDPFLPY